MRQIYQSMKPSRLELQRNPYFAPGGGSAITFLAAEFEAILTPASPSRINEVAYSPSLDLFVCIAEGNAGVWNNNNAATSSSADSNSWTNRALRNGSWQSIAWSPVLGLFATCEAGTSGQQINTSPDGIVWTNRTTPAKVVSYRRIIWGGDKFVGVGQTVSDASLQLGAYSTDGILWNPISAANNSQWRDIAYSPTLDRYVACAGAGAGTQPRFMQSSNGINFTSVNVPVNNRVWSAIEWIPEQGVFLAVTGDNSNKAVWSASGLTGTWNEIDIDPTAQPNVWYGLAWSPLYQRYAMVSDNGSGSQDLIGVGASATTDNATTIQEAPSLSSYRRINWYPEKGFWLAGGIEVAGSAIIRSCARVRVD